MAGEFFESFFSDRGPFIIKTNNEVDVLCPFPHSKGFETRPSAHVNVEKGVFHCKTCFAESLQGNGGLSEVGFIAKFYNMSYKDALKYLATLDGDLTDEDWGESQNRLWETPDFIDYLKNERGLTEETIHTYQLGYTGDGIIYPVFINHILIDKRTYNKDYKIDGQPKIKSEKGASPLLFPYDHWKNDTKDTLLCAGENDTLLARQNGFNAITVTGGEGTFPEIFLGHFKDKNVFICFDCDDAGKTASRRVAFLLHEAGANVHIINLGLEGTKEDKDITDFFLKHGHNSDDLYQLMQESKKYSPEDYQKDKNIVYPLLNLWEVGHGENEGKRFSSRVIMSGKYDMNMRIPTAIEWKCDSPVLDDVKSPCHGCKKINKKGWWFSDDERLKDILYLVEQDEKTVEKEIKSRFIGVPDKCPTMKRRVAERQQVYKVILTPDVETELSDEYRSATQHAYVVGNVNMDDGFRYRIYYRSYAHPLQGQRVYPIVDKIESSDNALNTFKMTPEIKEQLKVFQGNPKDAMLDRAKRMKKIIDVPYLNPDPIITAGVDLVYHSPLRFRFLGSLIEKGYPEGLIVGESRTGKTEAASKFMKYIGIGNMTVLKEASRASIMGGSEKLPNGGHKVTWGTIPKNHRGLVVLDEISGTSQEVFAALTDMRSSGIATLEKMGGGKAPAKTRLLWMGNPRQVNGKSKPLHRYAYGTDVVRELIGTDEDIARFDFMMIVKKDIEGRLNWMNNITEEPHPREYYRNLIYWIWSRTEDQIMWDSGVENYIKHIADEMNEKYDSDIKLLGYEAWKKIARIAIACAGATFSCTDDGECVLVKKEHVDWTQQFLLDCYINPVFKLHKFVESHRVYTETNETVNNAVARLINDHRILMKTLIDAPGGECSYRQLELVSGLDSKEFKGVMNILVKNYLIQTSQFGVMPTERLQKAVNFYRENYESTRMIPISEQGGSPV